jgi:TetR/AcrR family transcriptional regulator
VARRQARGTGATTTVARVRTLVPRDERRGQILDAAATLFSQRGFAGTTTRQIAAAVGTSETVLFRHFPTKESLYTAILEQWTSSADVDRWLDELRVLADRRDDEGLFRAVVTAILESYRRDPAYHRLMLFAALEDHELARIAHVRYSAPLTAFLREYVARRQAAGAFRRIRPELVVHMLLSAAAQYAQWTALGVNPLALSDDDIARQAVTLLAGLRA